ncbi:hypothetical protein BOH72_11135 [Mycobacterium sp. WY10]|nr:hypothetical protein BOH72_11135 [Mycobacterium sp. WY10]
MTNSTSAAADPESVALDLIVRIAEALPGGAPALRGALQHFAGALQLEGALSGLTTMTDARVAAATIAELACTADDAVGSLRIRAAAIRTGCLSQADVLDPDGLALALDGAATVLDAM